MSKKVSTVSNVMKNLYEAANNLFYANSFSSSIYDVCDNLLYTRVCVEYQRGEAGTRYIGIFRAFDGKEWVEFLRVHDNTKALIENEALICIINELNEIAMERNDVSFTSVYNKNPCYIERLVSDDVLVWDKRKYFVSHANNDIGFAMITHLFSLLGYTVKYQLGHYVFSRIAP